MSGTRRPPYATALVVLSLLAAGGEFLSRDQPAPLESAGWLVDDCVAYRNITRALLEHGSVDYRLVNPREARRFSEGAGGTRSATRSNVSLTADGRLVPKHSVLLPVVLVLPYMLAREVGLLLFNVAQCTLLVVLVYWLSGLFFPAWAAFAAAAAFLADGVLRNYMYNVSPDVFGAVLVLSGVVCTWRWGEHRVRLLLGGLLLGLSLWLRPINLVGFAALLPAAVAVSRRRRLEASLWLPTCGLLLGLVGYLLLNRYWFGDPFTTSYDRIVVMNEGVRTLESHRNDMNRPFWNSLLPTLVTSPQGFLQTAPHWPLLLPCLVQLFRRRSGEALALACLVFGPALFLVKYDHWLLSHFGNRFLFLPAAVSSIGVAWFVQALFGRGRLPEHEVHPEVTAR